MLKNKAEAEDLTQEAFLRVFRTIRSFRGESAFSSWLYRVAVNEVLMRMRKKRIAETSFEETNTADASEDKPRKDFGRRDSQLDATVDRVTIERAVKQLPPGYRSIVILHDVQGYLHEEIAAMLGCSIGNSKSQLHKGRMRLRKLLQPGRALTPEVQLS
jgi:RNA polymerase sigma-70 factor (ECF subfamily)